MRQLHGVLWTKGTLLSPQHLQVQDRYLQDLMHFSLSSLAFRPWGFRRLEVDREELEGGVFSLAKASGLFPDGLAFDIPESDPGPAPMALENVWPDPDQEVVTIHLVVPEQRVGAHNIATEHRQRDARYFAEVILRRDENTGKSEKPIQVARKNLSLVGGTEQVEGGAILPVARVVRSSAAEFSLDPEHVPPLLDLSASSYLTSMARRLVEVLTARCAGLAGARRERGAGLADFGVSDIANFWLLYTLNSHLPTLRHLFELGGSHPVRLFEMMLRLAGSLSTLSDEVGAGDLPTYDHADLGGCFRALNEQIHRLLGTVVPQRHVSLPLRELKGSVHATALDDDRHLQPQQAFLAARARVDRAALIRKLPHLVKVTSGESVDQLIKQALPGVSLRHVVEPPEALPVKLDYAYFQLELEGEHWDAIRRARNLAAYVPSDFPEPELELVLLLPREEPTS